MGTRQTDVRKDAHGMYVRCGNGIYRPQMSALCHLYQGGGSGVTVFSVGDAVRVGVLKASTLIASVLPMHCSVAASGFREAWYLHGTYDVPTTWYAGRAGHESDNPKQHSSNTNTEDRWAPL